MRRHGYLLGVKLWRAKLLSVGAKLIAYSRPGCPVVIDEPEVSLNAWQQQYTELVLKSPSHAPEVMYWLPRTPSFDCQPSKWKRKYCPCRNGWHSKFKQSMQHLKDGALNPFLIILGIPSALCFHLNRDLVKVLLTFRNRKIKIHLKPSYQTIKAWISGDRTTWACCCRNRKVLNFINEKVAPLTVEELQAFLFNTSKPLRKRNICEWWQEFKCSAI